MEQSICFRCADKHKGASRHKSSPSCSMVASEDAPANTMTAPRNVMHNVCVQTGPFYRRIRPFAIFIRVMATFPLHNIRANDGRELKHKWISGILIYDFIVFMLVGSFFLVSSMEMIEKITDKADKYYLIIWIRFTILAAGLRNFIQFFICHIYAHKYPQLFSALEEYHQGVGAGVVETKMRIILQQLVPIFRTLAFMIFMLAASYSFFYQFEENTWPITISYVLVNLWKELPMNMFVCICAHLWPRFDMLVADLAKLRRSNEDSDAANMQLENLRLQYAALTNVLRLLQKCWGMQLALNILFFMLDTIIQLFIFFVFSQAQNVFLLMLTIYYFFAVCGVIFYIDRLERRTDEIIDELNAFELYNKSKSRKFQVQVFSDQIAARPIKITASGFCLINNSLIGALFGGIATYLIVMINFAPYIIEWANSTIPKHSDVYSNVQSLYTFH